MAVGQGFEPWKGVNPCRFSRPVPSTAQPTHLLERVMRFELTTASLATKSSTTELHPHILLIYTQIIYLSTNILNMGKVLQT